MTQEATSASSCTALIPYQPHFFPIPWKSSNGGTFTSAQLQPVQIPNEDDRPSPASAPLPRFELNLKVANMLARRATIMGSLNGGDFDVQVTRSPQDTAPPTLGSTNNSRLARSKSTPAIPRSRSTHRPQSSSSQQQQQLPASSTFATSQEGSVHVQSPILRPHDENHPFAHRPHQDGSEDDDVIATVSQVNHHDLAAPPSSLVTDDLYEEEDDDMVPVYSQDYVVHDDDDVAMRELNMIHGFDVDDYEDMEEYEEETLNGFNQPHSMLEYNTSYHQTDNEEHNNSQPVPQVVPHTHASFVSDLQDENGIDFTTPDYGHYVMRYEHCNHPRGIDYYTDRASETRGHQHEEQDAAMQQAQDDEPLVGRFDYAQDFEEDNHHTNPDHSQYGAPSGSAEKTASGSTYQDYIPRNIGHDVSAALDTTTELTEDQDHDYPPSSPPKHDPSIAQWRVGKISGHQGSYSRRVTEGDGTEHGPRGTKRTLNGDIKHTVERVLKKPFVTPRAVSKPVITKTLDLIDLSDGEDDPAMSPPSVPRLRKPAPFPLLTPTHRPAKKSGNLSKPFKMPARATPSASQGSPSKSSSSTPVSTAFHRSLAPSPMTHLGSSPTKLMGSTPISGRIKSPTGVVLLPSSASKSSPAQVEKNKITHLEARLRLLKEAINYQNNPEDEDEVSNLTEQWLAAGRDIAERLFDRLPKPDDLTPVSRPMHWGMTKGGGWASSRGEMEMSEEEKAFLKNVRRDEDGNPVDEDGNQLTEDINEGDVLTVLRESGARGGPYRPSMMSVGRYTEDDEMNAEETDRPQQASPETPQWTVGTMLARLSIEPSLLGWDAESEGWNEGEF